MDTGRVLNGSIFISVIERLATVAASFSFEIRKLSLKNVPLQALCAIFSPFSQSASACTLLHLITTVFPA